MSPRWSIIIVCVWGCWILGGSTIGVNSDVSADDGHPKTVKECRVHIEKALEEYWDKTEPNPAESTNSNKNSPSDQTDNENNSDDGNTNCNKEVEQVTQIDNDDNDDDDIQDSDQSSSQNIESQVESPKEVENSEPSDESKPQVTEAQQETRRVYVVKNLNKEPIEFDDLNSDKKEASTVTEEKDNDNGEEDDDDNDDEDDTEVEASKKNETEDAIAKKHDNEMEAEGVKDQMNDDKENVDNDNDDNDDDEEDEEEDDDEDAPPEVSESDKPKTIETPASEISSEAQINTSKVVEEKEPAVPEISPSVVSQSVVESSNLATESLEVPPQKPQQDAPIISSEKEAGPPKEELIENIYEEEEDDDEEEDGVSYRDRGHIDAILGVDEVADAEEEKLAQSVFKDIKKIELTNIKPMELLYKFADSTSRSLGDAEIFNRPMLLFLGPWNAGKTSIINYILGIERTPSALKTGTGITDTGFTVLTHGSQRRVISGTELATDWRYNGVQRFGQGFLDHLRSINIPHALLQKVTIVDTPGILENKKVGNYPLNDAFQWFIDRADAIYVILDPNKVDIGSEVARVIDQLKGREVRFVLNKADTIRRSDLMRVVGQLFWNLSPLMSSSEAPVIYAVSLSSRPLAPSAPAKFLEDQERNLFYDMRATLDRRVENRILYARKHAVRVRNHAKMVDCYLATFYRHKSIFSNKRNVAKDIVDNPRDYSIYDGLGSMTNVSRYDLPDPVTYKDFFRTHPLYDFKPLASTCSYFRGCPMDKLDEAISKDIPELLARYKKAKIAVQEVLPEGKP